jgi:hypothetical protein
MSLGTGKERVQFVPRLLHLTQENFGKTRETKSATVVMDRMEDTRCIMPCALRRNKEIEIGIHVM